MWAFVYDGLGRLIRADRYEPDSLPADRLARSEAYYYDGVRRIQAIETTWPSIPGAPETAVREYVWGPDYVDELVAQLDWGTTWGTGGPPAGVYGGLLDGSYNVVALVGDLRQPPQGTDLVRVQYTYEPYGGVVLRDEAPSGPLPTNSVGHQGLFFYRLDGPADADPLAPSVGLYHNRNRWLSPELGRFLQRDPNETTLPIVTAIAYNGDALAIVLGAFSPQGHYADGMNLYAYLGSNPVNLRDPLGLVFDPFGDVDDLIGSIQGERAAGAAVAAAQVGMFLNTSLILGQMMLSTLPFGDMAILMGKLALGSSVTWEDVAYAALSIGGGAIVLKYGMKMGRALAGYAGKLGQRAMTWLWRSARGLIRGARSLGALDNVFANPQMLKGIRSPEHAADLIEAARAAGWQVGKLGRGSHEKQGLKLAEVVGGKLTGRQIRWHPGGGHHGPRPYWNVCSPNGGKIGPIFVE